MQDEHGSENQQPGSDGSWSASASEGGQQPAAEPAAAGDAPGAQDFQGPRGTQPGGYGFGVPGQQPAQPGVTQPGVTQPGVSQPGVSQPGGYYSPSGSYGQGYGQPGGYPTPPGGYVTQPVQPGQGQPGGPGGYPPPGGYGFGGPGGYGQPGGYGPPRRRMTGVVAYIAVAAVAAAAGAGTVLLADNAGQQPSHSSASQLPAGGNLSPGGAGSGSQVSSATEQSVFNAVQPGIVDISSNLKYSGGSAAATGMVISSSGLVLTNNHVINQTTGMRATVVATGRNYVAKFLGYDKSADVAVIQLVGASGMKTVPLGNSAQVKLGNGVVALGNAGGTGQTTTVTGSITGLNQTITASDDGSGTSERLTDMLRTNANIVPGDSGGPLANTDGKVIGMDTAAATGSFGIGQQDVGFAIPINRALAIARQIIAGKGSGSVQIGSAGFLGVLVPAGKASVAADPVQQRKLQIQGEEDGAGGGVPSAGPGCIPNNLEAGVPQRVAATKTGALVLGDLCGTPATTAGMIPGDVITSVNGQRVTTPASLTAIMKTLRPGSKVTVTWVSVASGHHVTRTLTLASAPPQ